MNNYQEIIIQLLDSHSVIRSSDLSLRVMSIINPMKFINAKYLEALEQLIERNEIKQVVYTTKDRTRVVYFPGDVQFLIGK